MILETLRVSRNSASESDLPSTEIIVGYDLSPRDPSPEESQRAGLARSIHAARIVHYAHQPVITVHLPSPPPAYSLEGLDHYAALIAQAQRAARQLQAEVDALHLLPSMVSPPPAEP